MNFDENTSVVRVTGVPALLIILGIGFLAYGWPAMKIAKRTGNSPWIALLMSVPLVNIVVIWIFALARWPSVDREGGR